MKNSLFLFSAIALQLMWACSSLAHPGSGIAVDATGEVYFTDTGEGVWKLDKKGKLTLFSKTAFHWLAYEEAGRFSRSPQKFGDFQRITPTGSKPVLLLCSDFPCAFGQDGNLYYAETRGHTRIIRRTAEGKESVLVQGSPQQVFNGVTALAPGPDGSLYLMDSNETNGSPTILKVSMDRRVSTFSSGFLNTLGSPPPKQGNYCRGLVVHTNGSVFVAATERRCIVKVTPEGKSSLVLQAESPWSPTGVTIFQDELYVLEYSDMPAGWNPEDRRGWVPRVRKVDRHGNVVVVATVPRQAVVLKGN
jgi:streptogramin lyase